LKEKVQPYLVFLIESFIYYNLFNKIIEGIKLQLIGGKIGAKEEGKESRKEGITPND